MGLSLCCGAAATIAIISGETRSPSSQPVGLLNRNASGAALRQHKKGQGSRHQAHTANFADAGAAAWDLNRIHPNSSNISLRYSGKSNGCWRC